MNPALKSNLKKLKLSGLLSTLEVRLQEASSNQLSHLEFLEMLVLDEMALRNDRAIERRVQAARFRDIKRLEDFDFSFNSFPRKEIMEFATGAFVREKQDILFLGPPGVGKSHLAQAIGLQIAKMGFIVLYRSIFDACNELREAETFQESKKMIQRYLKPDLLIIDDMGLKVLPAKAGEHLFEIIMRRYETRSTIMTSNRPLEEWGKLIGDVPTATAILDRFLSRARLIQITGKSYRLKNSGQKSKKD